MLLPLLCLQMERNFDPFREYFGESEIPGKTQAKIRWQHRTEVMDHLYTLSRESNIECPCNKGQNGLQNSPIIKVGDLVVLHEEDKLKSGYWKLARVVEILPSRDGSVRKVKISLLRL